MYQIAETGDTVVVTLGCFNKVASQSLHTFIFSSTGFFLILSSKLIKKIAIAVKYKQINTISILNANKI